MYKQMAITMFEKFGFNVIPVTNKIAISKWERWQKDKQTLRDIEKMKWNHTTNGIGGVSGINGLRFIDVDKITNWDVLDKLLVGLKLPLKYSWLARSGSGSGAHIIFRAKDDDHLFKKLGGKKGVYKLKLREQESCDHLEIRWSDSYTVLPPSLHPTGSIYEFIFNEPTEKPDFIETETLLQFAEDFLRLDSKETVSKVQKNPGMAVTKQNEDYNPEEVEAAVDLLGNKLNEDCYNEWLEIGFSLASIGEEGRPYFLRLSLANKYYKDTEEELNKKFDGLLKDYDGRTTLSTLFFYARKYGLKTNGKVVNSKADFFQQAEQYLQGEYDFIYNSLKRKLFWKDKDQTEFREFDDSTLMTIFIELISRQKIAISFENLKRLLFSAFVPKYRPLEEYFMNLPEWDGTDYIDKLSNTVTVEEGSEGNWKMYLKKWLIATVAGALSDDVVNHTAIILQGPQGVGKTRWINLLIPNKLQDYLFIGNITNDKDSKLAVVKHFIINLDELETLNREEIGFLKSLMTQKDFELRKPYGYLEERYKRRSSFIGSINKMEFLSDPSGSRRFLCISVEKIDYEHNIDMDMVFAQAFHLYKSGEPYWFNRAEGDNITANNQKFTFQPLEEQLILGRYIPAGKNDPGIILMSSAEIAQEIMNDKPVNNNNTLRQIGMALSKYGFIKGSSYNSKFSVKKWILKRI